MAGEQTRDLGGMDEPRLFLVIDLEIFSRLLESWDR